MAQFTIQIADADVMKVLDAIGGIYGRPTLIDNPSFDNTQPESASNPRKINNTETPGQFANRITREWLAENVRAWAVKQAEIAVQQARDNANITITDPSIP